MHDEGSMCAHCAHWDEYQCICTCPGCRFEAKEAPDDLR